MTMFELKKKKIELCSFYHIYRQFIKLSFFSLHDKHKPTWKFGRVHIQQWKKAKIVTSLAVLP